MIAAGAPSYSIDFDRLCEPNKKAIGHYNRWYLAHQADLMHHREVLAGDCSLIAARGRTEDVFFLLNAGAPVEIDSRPATILNASGARRVFVRARETATRNVILSASTGEKVHCRPVVFDGWICLESR